MDRAGLRIGVGERDAGDFFLTRTLKNAELKRNPGGNLDLAIKMLNAGEIDAYAANRQRLSELAARVTGVRLRLTRIRGDVRHSCWTQRFPIVARVRWDAAIPS